MFTLWVFSQKKEPPLPNTPPTKIIVEHKLKALSNPFPRSYLYKLYSTRKPTRLSELVYHETHDPEIPSEIYRLARQLEEFIERAALPLFISWACPVALSDRDYLGWRLVS